MLVISDADWQRLSEPEREGLKALRGAGEARFALVYEYEHWALRDLIESRWKPLTVEFQARAPGFEALRKLLSYRKTSLKVWDLCCGLGQDAWMMASWGHEVSGVERNPILYFLLTQAQRNSRDREVAARLQLVHTSSFEFMDRASRGPDVIYLDPMYPERSKSALPKKELRIVKKLVGDDPDADALLKPARALARDRVIVKRPAMPPLWMRRSLHFLQRVAPSVSTFICLKQRVNSLRRLLL
jgi:16S rRNA (guanine1516-N2)-methyltransferase